jgi:hypothetical protein
MAKLEDTAELGCLIQLKYKLESLQCCTCFLGQANGCNTSPCQAHSQTSVSAANNWTALAVGPVRALPHTPTIPRALGDHPPGWQQYRCTVSIRVTVAHWPCAVNLRSAWCDACVVLSCPGQASRSTARRPTPRSPATHRKRRKVEGGSELRAAPPPVRFAPALAVA